MNILVLHSRRYAAYAYDRGIDHDRNNVFYIGVRDMLEQVPAGLRCNKIEIEGRAPLYVEVEAAIVKLEVAFDLLICVAEHELLDAARLRQRFNIPGPWPAQALKVRNKAVMKRCVAARGIRVPTFATLDAWLKEGSLPLAADSEVILKPVDDAAAVNVHRFASQSALRTALAQRTTGVVALDEGERPDYAGFEVEEYLSGPVLHIDGIARNGEPQIFIPSRYVNTMLDFANGKAAGSLQFEPPPSMHSWITDILAAVEIRHGAFHLEAIDHDGSLVFLEIAHRIGGARVKETFESKAGIHISVADLRTITDPDYVLRPQWDNDHYFGWFVVPGHHLNKPYCRVTGYEYLVHSEHLMVLDKLAPDKPVSTRVTYIGTSLPLAGMLRAKRPEDLLRVLNELLDNLVVEGCDMPVDECSNSTVMT